MFNSYHNYLDHFPNETCFTACFFKHMVKYNNKKILVDDETNQIMSFYSFQNITAGYSHSLKHILQKQPSKIVVTICGNSIEILAMNLALIGMGYTVMPLNPALTQYEIHKCLFGLDINIVIVQDQQCLSLENKYRTYNLFDIEHYERENNLLDPCKCNRETAAFIFFSSGTTGPPKTIQLNHNSLIAFLNQLICSHTQSKFNFVTVNETDNVFSVLPYFHLGGILTTYSMMWLGATIFVNRKWNAEKFVHCLQKNQITVLNVVPPILKYLHLIGSKTTLNYLKTIFIGASRVDPKIVISIQNIFKNVKISQLFGMTEAGLIVFMSPKESDDPTHVGIPFPGVESKIVNQELYVKTPTMMSGYFKSKINPFQDGWFPTGDLVEETSEGFLRIIGRVKDMIKIRGWQVNPSEIEELVNQVNGVEDCAVCGAHFGSSDRLLLFFVGDINSETINHVLKNNLISYKHPFWITRVRSINRTESGKIKRTQIKMMTSDF